MNSNLQFNFIVDKENKKLKIDREFQAERQLVWDCYTKSELLEKWFAPKPWKAKTKFMDFKNGGHWLYAMVSPQGEEHWGKFEFSDVNPIESYQGMDMFCDENGIQNTQLPSQHWDVTFEDRNEHTFVKTIISYKSLEDLETILKMGMNEGLTMTYIQLDELLKTLI